MTIIPGLPDHLKVVPPAPDSPADPQADQKRAAWRAWRDAVIDDNAAHAKLFDEATGKQRADLIESELDLCRAHPAYWLTRWAIIFEPRRGKKRAGGTKSFIPAAKQLDLIDWFLERMEDEETEKSDGVVSKSRGVGASWLFVALAAWGWLFEDPWIVLFVSWKEEFVDSKSQKSLFWKLDRLMRALPDWMLPAGYNPFEKPSDWRQDRMLTNLTNENQITGETTTTLAARGDRMSWLMIDEASFVKAGFMPIWSGAAESTDHRFAVSTESFEVSRDFYELGIGNRSDVRPALFEFDYWQLPTNDDEWVERERKRHTADPGAFERELTRNPHAGMNTWVYPAFWDMAKYAPNPDIRYNPLAGALHGGIDPGFLDKFAMVWVQHDPVGNYWNVLDAYQNKGQVADFYASIINGEFESGEWRYDDEAIRLMDWTATLGATKWWGDTYGDNSHGATYDTVYTRLAKKGVLVNRRRNGQMEETPTLKAARTYRGRQEALRDYLTRLRFANTPGAHLMLKALQEHRFQREEGSRTAEPNKPEHDWTSHLVSALEFIFVNVKLRQTRDLAGAGGYARPNAALMGARLPQPPVLRRAG